MRKAISLATFVFTYLLNAHGWSHEAHERIASLAHDLMKEDKRAELQSILISGKPLPKWMVEVSTWADGPGALEDGGNHFVHVSSCRNPSIELQCGSSKSGGGVCIVEALVRNIQRAITSPTGESLRESLMYIIHYMADIHQPLHVALESDAGGNTIKGLRPFSAAARHDVSLHELWDIQLYQLAKNKSMFKDGFPKYNTTTMDFTLEDLESEDSIRNLVAQIALQTATQVTCEVAYWSSPSQRGKSMPSGTFLDGDYIKNGREWTVIQVARAGIRLASLLSSIVESRAAARAAAAARNSVIAA